MAFLFTFDSNEVFDEIYIFVCCYALCRWMWSEGEALAAS